MAEGIGERFAHALANKDAAGLKALLAPEVDFRAMTPGKFWESNDVDAIVDETILGTWFALEARITDVLSVQTQALGSRDRVGYRFTVNRPDGDFTIEQQAYYESDGGQITWLRIMCSGYLPVTT